MKMKRYRLGIFTSLYDDYAVELLRMVDEGIADGTLRAEVPFVLINVGEGTSSAVDKRIEEIKGLKNLRGLIFFPSKEFEPLLRREGLKDPKRMLEWRIKHDRAIMDLLPADADSILLIGYMQMIGPELLKMNIVNLHPAIPNIGPVGMWPKVIEEQVERPLPYLLDLTEEELKGRLREIMSLSRHKAGGMLHLVSEETDRGPVIAWYEFAPTSKELDELWMILVRALRIKPLQEVKKESAWKELTEGIRQEQFKGEKPLILIAYRNLTHGLWEIQDKKLYIKGLAHPEGYCLNWEIREYLRQRGIVSLI